MENKMSWVEKYRPARFDEIKGQNEAVEKVRNFVKNRARKKNSMILYGPPGTGKTSLAHAAANEMGAEIFEINASDFRSRDKLDQILRPAMEQKSLTNSGKIILVDEVDGISEADWGGLPELISLIDAASWPVILTANDIWDKKFSALRKKCELVQLKEIDYRTVKDVLISVLRKEGKFIDNDILTGIAVKARGDLRAAINDLHVASGMEDPSKILDNERNREVDIFNALRFIFKEKSSENTLRILDSVNLPLDQIMLWIEENIPAEYRGKELYKAYDLLSLADVFNGRIYKQQYWRFLVYENIFLSYGIASAKTGVKHGFTNYRKPERVLKIWVSNQRDMKKKSIARKYADYAHVGIKRAMYEFPLIKTILKNPAIRKELKLEKEEEEYLDAPSHSGTL